MSPPPVVMIHGAFCAGWMFEHFREPFEARGHRVSSPDLPGHEPGASRNDVAGRSMSAYAEAVARLCDEQTSPPVLIGHSMGGLVAQLAAAKTELSGLILLAPSPPWGVHGSSLTEALGAASLFGLGPFWAMAVEPDYAAAHAYLFERLPKSERRATFERMTPESGRALFEALNWWLDPFATTLVTRRSARAPVLAIAGDRDTIHPPATVEAVSRRLGGRTVTLENMGHWLPREWGWEQVANLCLNWIDTLPAQHGSRSLAASSALPAHG